MKEIWKTAQTDGKVHCVHGLEELILLKCPFYQALYRFSTIPIKIQIAILTEIK